MADWLFSDMGFLFFTTWSILLVAVIYAAFTRDLQPSKVISRTDAMSGLTSSSDRGGRYSE